MLHSPSTSKHRIFFPLKAYTQLAPLFSKRAKSLTLFWLPLENDNPRWEEYPKTQRAGPVKDEETKKGKNDGKSVEALARVFPHSIVQFVSTVSTDAYILLIYRDLGRGNKSEFVSTTCPLVSTTRAGQNDWPILLLL